MKNPDFIIILLLGILLFCLLNSNKELFNLQTELKKMYPMFSPREEVNSAKGNLSNSQLKIFNNILQNIKYKINRRRKKNPYTIDYLAAKKTTRILPEATTISKLIVKKFNKQNSKHNVYLNKVGPAYTELYNRTVSLTFDMNLEYTVRQNISYSKSGFAKNTFQNFIVVRVYVFFPLTPKPDLSKLYIKSLDSKELANNKYIPGRGFPYNYPFRKDLSNKIIFSSVEITRLLSGRETESVKARLKKIKDKKKQKEKKKKKKGKKNPLTKFLLNSPKTKKENFINKSLSDTILNPPTEDINDYFSFLEN
jgi:hypothetical protein